MSSRIGDKYYALKETSEAAQGPQLCDFEKRNCANDHDTCRERSTCQWTPLRIFPEATIEHETAQRHERKPDCSQDAVHRTPPGRFPREHRHRGGIGYERAGQQNAAAEDHKQPRPKHGAVVIAKLLRDATGKREEQESGHDEARDLNPAVGADRVFARCRAEPIEIWAQHKSTDAIMPAQDS